jgi:hypothetical protein
MYISLDDSLTTISVIYLFPSFSLAFNFPFRFIPHRHSLGPSPLILFIFSAPLRALYRTGRMKETVTPQLAKLLIYSLFNQINERVETHFYAPSPVIYGLW